MGTQKIDWGEMLSITGQEKKKYKNADKMHEIVIELSNLDAWVIEATRKKGELEEANSKLELRGNELIRTVKDAKDVHTEIVNTVESLRTEAKSLNSIIDSGGAAHKAKIDTEVETYKSGLMEEANKEELSRCDKLKSMDNEIISKQKKIDAADKTLDKLKLKLEG